MGSLLKNRKILTYHKNGDIQIYNSSSYSLDFEIIKLHPSAVTFATELDNGKIITGDENGRIKIFNLTTDSYLGLQEIKKHNNRINCIINLTENRFATSSSDGKIIIWNNESFEVINTLTKHNGEVRGLIQKKNGDFVSGGYYSKKLYFWDLKDCISYINIKCTSYNLIELDNDCILVGSYDYLYVTNSNSVINKYENTSFYNILWVRLISEETVLFANNKGCLFHVDYIKKYEICKKENFVGDGQSRCAILFEEKNEVFVVSDNSKVKVIKNY